MEGDRKVKASETSRPSKRRALPCRVFGDDAVHADTLKGGDEVAHPFAVSFEAEVEGSAEGLFEVDDVDKEGGTCNAAEMQLLTSAETLESSNHAGACACA